MKNLQNCHRSFRGKIEDDDFALLEGWYQIIISGRALHAEGRCDATELPMHLAQTRGDSQPPTYAQGTPSYVEDKGRTTSYFVKKTRTYLLQASKIQNLAAKRGYLTRFQNTILYTRICVLISDLIRQQKKQPGISENPRSLPHVFQRIA